MNYLLDPKYLERLNDEWEINEGLQKDFEQMQEDIINGNYNPESLQLFYKECDDFKDYKIRMKKQKNNIKKEENVTYENNKKDIVYKGDKGNIVNDEMSEDTLNSLVKYLKNIGLETIKTNP